MRGRNLDGLNDQVERRSGRGVEGLSQVRLSIGVVWKRKVENPGTVAATEDHSGAAYTTTAKDDEE